MKYEREKPCATCPYRREARLALWSESEFLRLLKHDADPVEGLQFACHHDRTKPHEDRSACVGWLLDQKRRHIPSLQLRMRLGYNEEAREHFTRINEDGLDLYSSVEEMYRANYPKKGRRKCTNTV